MRKVNYKNALPLLKPLLIFAAAVILFTGCRKGEELKFLNGYKQTNLVADTAGFNASIIDPNLVNAWGVAIVPAGPIWISANHTSLSTIYNRMGIALRGPVTIEGGEGAPTGQVFNTTGDFMLSNNQPAKFIFAGEDGTITAWNGGNDAGIVANRGAFDAVYKGIAMGNDGTGNFLYATNFKGRKIDVFDKTFTYVNDKPFNDPYIPGDFGPFNIRNIDGLLYVTYAKLKGPDNEDDQAGPGNGFIDIFTTGGKLVRRFASRGALNSPWGILQATTGIDHVPNAILVGNFGDGRISVFDQHGFFVGQLRDPSNHAISIDGLWDLENNVPGGDPNQIFFTAGPNDESHGLFGYLSK